MKDFGIRSNLVVVLLTLSTMLGCSALNASQPGAQPATGLVTATNSLDFGTVTVGTAVTRINTIVNNTRVPLVLTRAQVSQSDFTISGQKLPLKLAPGQSTAVAVVYSPRTGGTSQGKVVFASNVIRSSASFSLKGTAVASGRLTLNPAKVSFGNVAVGQSQTQSVTVTNAGIGDVTLSHSAISGKGFALSGLNLPLLLKSAQSTTVQVNFTPTASGTNTGTISLIGTTTVNYTKRGKTVLQDAPTGVAVSTISTSLNVPVSGVGTMVSGQLTASPSIVALGRVKVGASQTQTVSLVNSGDATVTVQQATVSGRGFKMSGLSFPVTLSPKQKKTFSVTFTPQSAGTSTGEVAVTSDAPNSVMSVPVSATAVGTGGALSTSDSSLDFASVQVGSTATLPETLTNTGGSTVTVSQATVSNAAFKVTGLTLPLILSAGQSFTFGTVFSPTTGGSSAGSISVVSDASNPSLTISMSGTATVSGQLAVTPAALNFGSVVVGQSKSMSASLAASGSSITVTGASMSTSEFTVSGISFPVTVAAGKSVTFTVNFTPQSSGTAGASASFISNAANSSAVATLTGSATAAPQHSVALSWNASTSSSVAGYNIYRGTTTGGPYSKIDSLNPDTTFNDSSVQSGQTYFYVTTAVDGSGTESARSNQTQAVIPTP